MAFSPHSCIASRQSKKCQLFLTAKVFNEQRAVALGVQLLQFSAEH